jgi:DNA polymerase V
VVLSNNDGCVIARSEEVKKLGVDMGVPVFKIRRLIEKYRIRVFSSNYTLYGDMSDRVMQTLSRFSPDIEVYSIDEAFLDLSGFKTDLNEYAERIRKTVRQWTGIPVSIGIAPTKTLAKAANHIAKKSKKCNGVFQLSDRKKIEEALSKLSPGDIWGIGERTAAKLKRAGIRTAAGLKNADINWIKNRFGITGVRTVYELAGHSCYPLELNPDLNKSIVVSRSFGKSVEALEELKQAASSHTARAAEKLREQGLAAGRITVFANTNRFKKNSYSNCRTYIFDTATSYTPQMMEVVLKMIEQIYRKGMNFKKCGVLLTGLEKQDNVQLGLFGKRDNKKSQRLMNTVDFINSRTDSPLRWAGEGLEKPWKIKFNHRSKRYTTRWEELLEI